MFQAAVAWACAWYDGSRSAIFGEETAQQILDSQQQKVRDSGRSALIQWARACGEGSDYIDNVLRSACIRSVTGTRFQHAAQRSVASTADEHASLKYLMLHNVDTLGASVDRVCWARIWRPSRCWDSKSSVGDWKIAAEDWAWWMVDPRLIEGLAMPSEPRIRADFLQREYDLDRHRQAA